MSGWNPETGRNLYGRRSTHKLRPAMKAAVDNLLPRLRLPGTSHAENPQRLPFDLSALFPGKTEIWLEVGFGGGEHLLCQALAHPQIGMIGCEHYVDGVAKLLRALEQHDLDNIRIHPHDARDVMDLLPDGSISRLYLLYPDPWHKKRHHKRRFIARENLDLIARVLKPGGELRIASDIDDYIRHALQNVAHDPRLEWVASGPQDWKEPWAGWPGTRYEAKALAAGRVPTYLTIRRL